MRYAAFFRGINVGGKNIARMAQMRKMFEGRGCVRVQTYIQSGNVVFDAQEAWTAGRIERAFEEEFGFKSAVTLRTWEELAGIVDNIPFSEEEIEKVRMHNPDVEHMYIYLFEALPHGWDKLPQGSGDVLRRSASGTEAYLLCRDSVRDSKLAAALGRLSEPATARNERTVRAVLSRMEE